MFSEKYPWLIEFKYPGSLRVELRPLVEQLLEQCRRNEGRFARADAPSFDDPTWSESFEFELIKNAEDFIESACENCDKWGQLPKGTSYEFVLRHQRKVSGIFGSKVNEATN